MAASIHAYRLSEAIKRTRIEQDLTQEELGERIGVKRAQISGLEKGYSISTPTTSKVFKTLGVPAASIDLRKIGKVVFWQNGGLFVNAYLYSMIYPTNFEGKIGFDKIRELLEVCCLSTLDKEQVNALAFCTDPAIIGTWPDQTRGMRHIQQEDDSFPLQCFFDMRQAIAHIRLENTYLEEDELFDLRRSLETIITIVRFPAQTEGDDDDDA